MPISNSIMWPTSDISYTIHPRSKTALFLKIGPQNSYKSLQVVTVSDTAKSPTCLLAELTKFLWPGDEKDDQLYQTEASENVDHDVTIVVGSRCTGSVHATQHRLMIYFTCLKVQSIQN